MEGKVNAADVLHIFRAYDVRGVYGKDLSDGVAQGIGAALAEFIGEGRTVCVARDYRNSSNPLKAAFLEGALSPGV